MLLVLHEDRSLLRRRMDEPLSGDLLKGVFNLSMENLNEKHMISTMELHVVFELDLLLICFFGFLRRILLVVQLASFYLAIALSIS